MLRDGSAPASRIGYSQRAERRFLDIPWDQQVAVMFQIDSALVLVVPEVSACLDQLQGFPPNVLLSPEPWGQINHSGSLCIPDS